MEGPVFCAIYPVRGDHGPASRSEITFPGWVAEAVAGAKAGVGAG
jgi:hypothetical protein